MSLTDIKDQATPVRLLQNIITTKRIPHGLLFWGPDGVGKFFSAMQFAKAMNCKESNTGCNDCLNCRKINHGNHPDLTVLAPKSKSQLIIREDMEPIIEMASYPPFEAAYRTIIIKDADRMNIVTQNYFLKTLEEPPSNTLFILLSSAPGRMLPTIRSRCQQVRFGSLKPETVVRYLIENREITPEKAAAVSIISQGQISRALDLVDTERRNIVIDMVKRLDSKDDPVVVAEEFSKCLKVEMDALKAAVDAELSYDKDEITPEELEELDKSKAAIIGSRKRRVIYEYLYLFKVWYRDVLVFHSTAGSGTILNSDMKDVLEKSSPDKTDEKLKAIEKSWLYLERNLTEGRVLRDLFCVFAG